MLPFRHEKMLSANQGSGDDANVIFQIADVRSLQQRPQHATSVKKREISMHSQSQSHLNSKYLWFVSLLSVSLHPRRDVSGATVQVDTRKEYYEFSNC